MNQLGATVQAVAAWFARGSSWQGDDGVPVRLLEHMQLAGLAMGVALVLGVPLALALGHLGRGGFFAINVSNVGRALPSFAILVLVARIPQVGIGDAAALVALVALAVPPLVTNTYVGIRSVDPDVVDAARGMGLSGAQVLLRVELPLSVPLVLAGVRTSTVQVIATTTIAAFVSSGGLGRYIVDGLAQGDVAKLYAGALLVAVLSLVADQLLGLLQRRVSPPDTRPARTRRLARMPPASDPEARHGVRTPPDRTRAQHAAGRDTEGGAIS